MTKDIFATETLLILIISILVGALVVVAFIINIWIPFMQERRYLKLEIERTSGNERKYWERELKKLYVRVFPFATVFMKKSKNKKRGTSSPSEKTNRSGGK